MVVTTPKGGEHNSAYGLLRCFSHPGKFPSNAGWRRLFVVTSDLILPHVDKAVEAAAPANVKLEPGWLLNMELSELAFQERVLALAEETFHHLLRVRPDDIWAMNSLGVLLIDQDEDKNLERAMGLWERSLAIEPVNPGACFLLGEAWLKKGNLKKALQHGALAAQHRATWGTPFL